ncbi:hypothetical protein HDU76_002028 [Blyttiomyces sp. JEL0837]|nr:hypothetical protein HDU76_002028 [Blyttiomyces sp. JEL0837]
MKVFMGRLKYGGSTSGDRMRFFDELNNDGSASLESILDESPKQPGLFSFLSFGRKKAANKDSKNSSELQPAKNGRWGLFQGRRAPIEKLREDPSTSKYQWLPRKGSDPRGILKNEDSNQTLQTDFISFEKLPPSQKPNEVREDDVRTLGQTDEPVTREDRIKPQHHDDISHVTTSIPITSLEANPILEQDAITQTPINEDKSCLVVINQKLANENNELKINLEVVKSKLAVEETKRRSAEIKIEKLNADVETLTSDNEKLRKDRDEMIENAKALVQTEADQQISSLQGELRSKDELIKQLQDQLHELLCLNQQRQDIIKPLADDNVPIDVASQLQPDLLSESPVGISQQLHDKHDTDKPNMTIQPSIEVDATIDKVEVESSNVATSEELLISNETAALNLPVGASDLESVVITSSQELMIIDSAGVIKPSTQDIIAQVSQSQPDFAMWLTDLACSCAIEMTTCKKHLLPKTFDFFMFQQPCLGKGAFAAVFKAQVKEIPTGGAMELKTITKTTGHTFAAKVIKLRTDDEKEAVNREVKALAQVSSHTFIPKFYGMAMNAQGDLLHMGDVKPANVLIDENGFPLLTDFGVAQSFKVKETSIYGTVPYMSPECFDEDQTCGL